jgi:hypothetical protein
MARDNTLITILTTSDVDACVRAYQSARGYDTTIVVNSPDPEYYHKISDTLPDATIIETPCTGTPGQGKQTTWDYFLNTDYEYMICQEGDDVFLPGGIEKIISWQHTYPSNAWMLCGEDIIYDDSHYANWRAMDLDVILTDTGLTGRRFDCMKSYMQTIFKLVTHRGYQHQRIIQIDRRVAESFSYNTQIAGSEDVLMTSHLKLSHLRGECDVCYVESPDITCYIKSTQHGAGRQFMRSDTVDLTTEFYSGFTESELELIANTELLNHKLPVTMSDFSRKRHYLKLSRCYHDHN